MELGVEDTSNGNRHYSIMYYADVGATQVNSYFKDANEMFSNWTELTDTGTYDDTTYMFQSYAYFPSSGWAEYYSTAYFLSDAEFLVPQNSGYPSLCNVSPVVGMERLAGYTDIYGGTYYPCS